MIYYPEGLIFPHFCSLVSLYQDDGFGNGIRSTGHLIAALRFISGEH